MLSFSLGISYLVQKQAFTRRQLIVGIGLAVVSSALPTTLWQMVFPGIWVAWIVFIPYVMLQVYLVIGCLLANRERSSAELNALRERQ